MGNRPTRKTCGAPGARWMAAQATLPWKKACCRAPAELCSTTAGRWCSAPRTVGFRPGLRLRSWIGISLVTATTTRELLLSTCTSGIASRSSPASFWAPGGRVTGPTPTRISTTWSGNTRNTTCRWTYWSSTWTGTPPHAWTGYTWDRELFPDPPAFLRWVHDKGLRATLNLHPAQGVQVFKEVYPQFATAMGVDPATGHRHRRSGTPQGSGLPSAQSQGTPQAIHFRIAASGS